MVVVPIHILKIICVSKCWPTLKQKKNQSGSQTRTRTFCNKQPYEIYSGSALKLTVNDYPLSLFIPLGFYLLGILTYPIIRMLHRKEFP